MHAIGKGLGLGLLGGAIGLGIMEIVRRASEPLVTDRAPRPTHANLRERSMSPFGPHHEPGESATTAIGRLAHQKLTGHAPSPKMKSALSWLVHIAYGSLAAAVYGALRAGHRRNTLLDGIALGTGLWLFGDELAVPLLGLADKPSAYSSSRHLHSFAQHIGYGVATAATTRFLEQRM